MRFPKTLDAKPIITDGKGNEIVDLTFSTIKNPNFAFVDMVICTYAHEMRPDLVAELSFGSLTRLEELLKSNDISNPFSIEAGDVFLVPDLLMNEENFSSIGVLTDIRTKIKKQYIDSTKAPDNEKLNSALSNFNEREKTALPPNFAKEGDKEMLIKDGVIIFGPNVTRKKTKQESLLATEQYMNKIKSNKKNIRINSKTYKKNG